MCFAHSPPAAGRFCDMIPLRRSAIHSGAFFLLYRNRYFSALSQHSISYRVKKNVLCTFSACVGSLLRHNSTPPQCDPQRSVFLLYRKRYFSALSQHNISYRAKKLFTEFIYEKLLYYLIIFRLKNSSDCKNLSVVYR